MPSARRVGWAKFRVSIVSIAAILILLILIYLLSGSTLFQGKASLYVYINDATGLAAGSLVSVDGVNVGSVDSIDLSGSGDPNRAIRVTMSIARGQMPNIPADSSAQLSIADPVGDKFIDITSGRSTTSIASGAEIAFKAQPELVRTLDLRQFDQQLRDIDATLRDIEEGRSLVGQFIVGEEIYTDLKKRLGEFDTALHNAVATTGTVGSVLYSDQLIRQVEDPFVQLDRTLARIQSGQGAAGQFLREDAAWQQALQQSSDLRRYIANLRGQDFFASDTLYNNANLWLASFIRSIDQFNANPDLNTAATYESLSGMAREWSATIKDFRENPKKYMRIKVF